MSKPIIVLSPQSKPMEAPFQQNYMYTNAFNTEAITKAGGIPVIPQYVDNAAAEELLTHADGLFLTGGGDVDPSLYGQEKLQTCGQTDTARDISDCALLRAALKLKKPIICICRGFQLTNAYFGGTLYQDIPSQYPTSLRHPNFTYPDYTEESTHSVTLVEHTPLQKLLGVTEMGVNSLHHQGIDCLADCLRPMAYAPDGLVEAWYLADDTQWLWGIQWHPEMMDNSPRGEAIFRAFIDACGK